MKNKQVQLGIGISNLKFGLPRLEVAKLIGLPDEIETKSYDEEDREIFVIWYYKKLGLILYFDEEVDWKLNQITIESENYTILDRITIGQELNHIEQILFENNIFDLELVDFSNEIDSLYFLISIESVGLNLWFDNNILTEIQISPIFEFDKYIWPKI